jgi:RNA polymerase sigma-70 factor (ECF subfamily)
MSESNAGELVEHLFRTEYGKLASTLARSFGLDRLGVVEDIVQDTLLTALRQWSFRAVPSDPTAWLYRVARNKALDHLRHERVAAAFAGIAASESQAIALEMPDVVIDSEIADSQLRMIFACCHPGLSSESQIAMTLKTLCGFSVQEIASAFLSNEATIEKRLQRARKYFREHHVKLEPPTGPALRARITNVLATLYLLFNEGYKRSHSDGLVQRDLLLEALRLALLVSHQFGEEYREAYALVSLMLFHVARLETRTGASGEIVLLSEQDRAQWNAELLQKGLEYSALSAPDEEMSHYHIEAAIQAQHCLAPSFEATDWAVILGLYKRLYAVKPSPIVLLHMSVSVSHVFGAEDALALLENLPLRDYYLYHAMRGDFLLQLGRMAEAGEALNRAIELSMNEKERALLVRKLGKSSA